MPDTGVGVRLATHTTHAAERAAERLGAALTAAESDQIVMDITDAVLGVRHVAVMRAKQVNGNEKWAVVLRGKWVTVAYAPQAAKIVTVMHP